MKDVGSILIVVVVTVALASRADAASLWSQPTNVGTNAAFHCGAANVGGAALGSVTVRSVCNNGSATAPQVCAPLNPQATCDGPTAGPSDGQLECWCEVTVTGGSTTSVRAAMQLSPLPVTPDGLPKLVIPATDESTSTAASIWSLPTNIGTNATYVCSAANVGDTPLGSVTVQHFCNNGGGGTMKICAPLNPQTTCDSPTGGPSDGQLECWCEVGVTGGSATSVRAAMQLSPLPVTPDGLPKLVVPATAESTSSSACCGDCNGDGIVTINEIITTVNFALNECPATQ